MILNAKFGGNSSQIIKLAGFMHGSLPHDAAEKNTKSKLWNTFKKIDLIKIEQIIPYQRSQIIIKCFGSLCL